MKINRRSFILGSTAAAALAGCATNKIGARKLKDGEKRRYAMIGCGIQMRNALIPQFLSVPTVEIVAVCDCDKTRREFAANQVNEYYKNDKCAIVSDFRDIIEDTSIDAVCIATPDHWHAYICVEAMKHGKDVYCEKPLTFSVDEARKVIAAQKKYGRVFQTGSMQRSWKEFYTAVMIVRNGFIGDVKYVDANYGSDGDKFGGTSHPLRFFDDANNQDKEGAPNPDVDWNMWLGPAKQRPYSDNLAPRGVHWFYPMFWRFDDDIALGLNGDWGAHHLDIAQWGLDMDDSGPYKAICSSSRYSVNPIHGGRRQCGMKMIFKDKVTGDDIELQHGPFGVWGTIFYGTNGIVAVNRGKIAVWEGTGLVKPTAEIREQIANATFMTDKIVAQSIGADYGTDALVKDDDLLGSAIKKLQEKYDFPNCKVQLYKSNNQVENFCQCVESREMTISPAEVGGRGATLCALCNLSYIYDSGFDWDGKNMKFKNGTGDEAWLRRSEYRNGWEINV